MEQEHEWWPNTPWRMEGFRADPALCDGFVELHKELGAILDSARERGEDLVPVDVRVLSTIYYALLTQIQMSNQSILLEIQELRNEIKELKG